MGAMIMFGLVDTLAIAGLIYYFRQRKVEQNHQSTE